MWQLIPSLVQSEGSVHSQELSTVAVVIPDSYESSRHLNASFLQDFPSYFPPMYDYVAKVVSSFPPSFATETLYAFLAFAVNDNSHVLSPTSLNQWTHKWWVQIMKFLIMKYSPPFCDFVLIASKNVPLVGVNLFLDTLNPNDVFRWEWDA